MVMKFHFSFTYLNFFINLLTDSFEKKKIRTGESETVN